MRDQHSQISHSFREGPGRWRCLCYEVGPSSCAWLRSFQRPLRRYHHPIHGCRPGEGITQNQSEQLHKGNVQVRTNMHCPYSKTLAGGKFKFDVSVEGTNVYSSWDVDAFSEVTDLCQWTLDAVKDGAHDPWSQLYGEGFSCSKDRVTDTHTGCSVKSGQTQQTQTTMPLLFCQQIQNLICYQCSDSKYAPVTASFVKMYYANWTLKTTATWKDTSLLIDLDGGHVSL